MHFSLSALGRILRQEPRLFLQLAHNISQFLDHAFETTPLLLLREHNAEIEDELIAVVDGRLQAHGRPENAIAVRADLNQVPAKLLTWYHEEGYIREVEERGGPRRSGGGRDYRAIGNLMNNLAPYNKRQLQSVSGI